MTCTGEIRPDTSKTEVIGDGGDEDIKKNNSMLKNHRRSDEISK